MSHEGTNGQAHVRRHVVRLRVPALAAGTLVIAGCLGGCLGDKGVAPSLRPGDETLGAIVVAPLNAIIAVGDTLHVTFTATTLTGASITSFDSVQYFVQRVADTLRVKVSSDGSVVGLAPSLNNSPVLLDVVAFKGGIAAADQTVIQVTVAKIIGATLSIHPVPPDSTKMQWGDTKRIVPVIRNAGGQRVTNPTVRYEYGPGDSATMQCYVPAIPAIGDLTQAQLRLSDCGQNGNTGTVSVNRIHAFRKGTAWVHAHVSVYGVMLHDSVQFTITNPYGGGVQVGAISFLAGDPARSNVFIAPGGRIDFINGFDQSFGALVSYTFEDPSVATVANPPSPYGGTTGNITPLTSQELYSSRVFLQAGVYRWTATVTGAIPPYTGATATGTITVE